jgi:hypothetical protein
MTRPCHDLENFGRAMARAQDEALDRIELRTKERLLSASPGARRAPRTLALALAAAALLCALWWLWLGPVLRPSPLTFQIGDPPETGRVEEWIAAPPDASLGLRFSDGTVLDLGPSSRMRVTETNAQGAVVVVERGRVRADVIHREGSSLEVRWRLHVGPYELRVRGTRFTASWDPDNENLGVELEEGALVVAGPGLEDERAIGAGTKLEAHAPDHRVTMSKLRLASTAAESAGGSAPAADAGQAQAPEGIVDAAGGVELATDAGSTGSGGEGAENGRGGSTSEPSWRQLFRARNYAAALRRAQAEGFDRLCQRSDPSDLMALAETARKGGAPDLAAIAWLQLRARFPSDGGAAIAAYELGTIVFDYHRDYRGAVQWFSTYLG